jgi:hypothetical protein
MVRVLEPLVRSLKAVVRALKAMVPISTAAVRCFEVRSPLIESSGHGLGPSVRSHEVPAPRRAPCKRQREVADR